MPAAVSLAGDGPALTHDEREAINAGRWFASLSPSLRHEMLRCARVRRYRNGQVIAARGDPPQHWLACARGAIRASSTSPGGKQVTLSYIEPGNWFNDIALFDGEPHRHDVVAHGETTVLRVDRADFHRILATHTELYDALLRLHIRRLRQLFGLVEALNTLPLRARLAKQLLHLMRGYGVPDPARPDETRIGIQLAQEELAQLLGASRQRVNRELKSMERERAIRVEPAGLVVCNLDMLMKIGRSEEES